MWKISFHVRREHLRNPTFQGGKLETVEVLTKASRRKKGKVRKSKKSTQTQKDATMGQRRVQFLFIGLVTKAEGPENFHKEN